MSDFVLNEEAEQERPRFSVDRPNTLAQCQKLEEIMKEGWDD